MIILLLFALVCRKASAQQQSLNEKISVTIRSNAENTNHNLYIQLPKSYGRLSTRYPVIVLFDAQDQSLFDYASTAIDRLMGTNDIPEAILIGVLQKDRGQELGVERNEAASAKFLQFIKDDLVNYLKQTYKINDYFTFIGHSLGGQFVTHAMAMYPETFKSVISISGALNYPASDQEYNFYQRKVLGLMEKYAANKSINGIKQKYYFSVGTDGMQDNMFRLGAITLDSILLKNRPTFLNWRFDEFKDFNHMTTPLVSIPAGLVFIYHDWHFSEDLAMNVLIKHKADPIMVLNQQQEQIKKTYGTDIALPGFIYYQFAHFCLNSGQLEKAELITGQLIKCRPDNDEPYALMAEILIKQGNKAGAIKQLKLAQARASEGKYQQKMEALNHNL